MNLPSRYRLNLTYEPVRRLLREFKALRGIPPGVGLSDSERGAFEVWAISEGNSRGIDVFGNADYIKKIIENNKRIVKYREGKL